MQKRVRIALVTLPIIVAVLVLGGLFLGFYLTEVVGSPSPIIYPILFSTLGLSLSLVVIYYLGKKAARL